MLSRRQFLRLGAAAAALAAAGRAGRAAEGDADRKKALEKPLPKRKLGGTGLEVGVLGLGCYYLGTLADDDAAVAVIRRALDLGVNWFDTAPSYGDGKSERRVGRALKGVRDRVLLATKSTQREGPGATKELEQSLERLGTDRVDLFQFHALKTSDDVGALFADGGAYPALEAARKAGKVRHLGFTGHYDPALLARVAKERPLETVLMPLNCIDHHSKSFEDGTLPIARERGLGVIAMKVFASGKLVANPLVSPTVEECVRYTLSLPVAAAIVGCMTVEELEADLACAKTFTPMDEKERKALLERTAPIAARKIEWYKQ